MKLITWLFSALIFNALCAQSEGGAKEKIYEIFDVTQPPSFQGGDLELNKFIYQNFNVPAGSKLDSLTGSKVVLSFIVDTLGQLTDIQILQEMGEGFGAEAVRVLQSMPPWIHGEINGQRVKVKFLLPIRIRLD